MEETANSSAAKKKKKGAPKHNGEAWYMKSVYLNLLNLPNMMASFGPLVNWYDGGGKGEKSIQFVKPLIPPGLREGVSQFFVTLMDKIYKNRHLEYFEDFLGLQETTEDVEADDFETPIAEVPRGWEKCTGLANSNEDSNQRNCLWPTVSSKASRIRLRIWPRSFQPWKRNR